MSASIGPLGLEGGRRTDQAYAEFEAVAHELKTPIAVALALCAIAAEEEDPVALHRDLDRIAVNVGAMREQLDALLDTQRLRDQSALRLGPVDLAALVRDSAACFEYIAARRSVHVVVDAPAALTAIADRERLGMAIRNLVANAVRHARDGGVVNVRLERTGAAGARIEVADDGPGVPELLREAVFERYRRFDRDGRRGGSGIGLAVVRDIAHAHGGSVAVVSASEGGALFALELPPAPGCAEAA